MGNNYELLVAKIDEFTRKFYLNKLLRGSIYAAAGILLGYLLLFVFVYFAHPNPATKTVLFFSFVLLSLFAIGAWIVKPSMAYFNLGRTLSVEQSARLIGDHFFNVKDRLLNTLQLKSLADSAPQQRQLILAGIDQKISELRPIPFASAINLGDNKKHIKYILVPLVIILSIGIIAPRMLREGTDSLVRYDEEILPQAPFQFHIENKTLAAIQGDDLTIRLMLTGDEFPQDIYIEDGANTYKLEKEKIDRFSYTFKNIQEAKKFRFLGGGFSSSTFILSVRPRPSLLNIRASLVYPAYLHRKNEELNNVGDLLVPEGTRITWHLHTENSQTLSFAFMDRDYQLAVGNNLANFSAVVRKSGNYRISPKNGSVVTADSLAHQLAVITDQFPGIEVTETTDSVSTKALYFSGTVTDDYGFSALKFKVNIKENGRNVSSQSHNIAIRNNQIENNFFYFWNLNDLNIKPGQVIEYFFEVADNDGVNGAKTSRSPLKTYQVPTAQQVADKMDANSEVLKQKMESTIKLANSIEKESKKLAQNLLDKKALSFEDKKQIEQLLDKQKQLEEAVKEIRSQNEKNNLQKNENSEVNKALKEKQEQIDELFNKVLDEKTKMLLQKLQQLMEMNNKDLTREELAKMQMDNKTLKNELDRILELYKQLEFEQGLQQAIDRLEKMAEDQKQLGQQSKDKQAPIEPLKNKQQALNKEFKSLQQELARLNQKNQELAQPNSFNNPQKESDAIEKAQEESAGSLEKNNRQNAAQKQEDAAEQMQKLAKKMQDSQDSESEKEDQTNAEELRRLLENLLTTSFEQEKVMLALRRMNSNDPSYVANVQRQNTIKDNMKGIADSLFSLSKRVPQIQTTVNSEVQKINFNIDKALDFLGDRRTAEANRTQQFAMTSLNNLALMLNEALESLQNSQKNGKPGKKGKKGMKELQQMQDKLNQQMQQAREKMQQGNMGTVPKGQMSQEFAKMAQQQQMIREALQKINKEDNKDGKGSLGNLNHLSQEMKQTELDLVNKRITQETMERQRNLQTRLLDADKAQRQQDEDSKRESNAAKDFPPSYRQLLEQFKKQQHRESETIQKLPPNLNYYYKNKIAEYFKLLNSSN